MNDLHKAYAILGLEPGASLESVMLRYKRLIMVWHPDRAPTPEHKEFAEEELKKINNAKDILGKHFAAGGGHRATGCDCQPGPATAGADRSAGNAGPGPNYQRSKTTDEKYWEEQAAKKRDAERKAREEQEANAKRAQQEYQQKTAQQAMESAMQQQRARADEKLRWQISIGLILAFIGLEAFGSMAIGTKKWWHDITWKWQSEHSTPSKPPETSTETGTSTGGTPYIPPYDRTPGGNVSTWQQEQQQRDKERQEQEKKQHDQDVYFARLDIDKYQKMIEHCNSQLTDLEIKIADPAVSYYERLKLVEMRDFRRKNLEEAQAGLKAAQDKLASLTGEAPQQTTPSLVSPLPGAGSGMPFTPLPSRYGSPFGPPADPNSSSLSPSNSITSPLYPQRKTGLDSLSSPSSSSTTFSELVKKMNSSPQTTTGTSTSNFLFGRKDPLSPPSPNSRYSELLKQLNTKLPDKSN
ncbi:MAG: DnaJ domain-containing protein [Candidatus Obscuribacterales bacterium]|nr:DnaJ domain-containing protein [Candidatus Obscuribacterales bacterium]